MKIFRSLAVALLLTVSAMAGTFTSTAGRFTANFVATPTVETRDVKTVKGETVTVTDFFAMANDKSIAQDVDYADFSGELTPQQLLDTAKAVFDGLTLDGVGKTESNG